MQLNLKLLILFLLLATSSFCQRDDQALLTIVKDITRDAKTDKDKVRTIYQWVLSNIKYDWKKYEKWKVDNNSIELATIEEILKSRKGVCADFALLGSKMFSMAGVNSAIIKGLAKFEMEDLYKDVWEFQHAWNAIQINGKWELLDLTWATLSYQYGDTSDYFFMTPPEKFIFSHFPDSSKWTLLDKEVTKSEFMNFPIVKWNNLTANVSSIPKSNFIQAKNDCFDLVLPIIENIDFELSDDRSNVYLPEYRIKDKQGDKVTYELKLPRKAKFILSVSNLVKLDDTSEDAKPLIYFIINNR